MNKDLIVRADPTKEFFIYMITRDIETQAAIAELIDNSIDGAKRIRKNDDYHGIEIDLEYDAEHFVIKDNCGGMDIATARDYAFRFGRAKDRPMEAGFYTGLFGIGMKRALFKLGKRFSIKSTTKNESFELEVDVDSWLKNEKWEFEFKSLVTDSYFDESVCGTTIEITKLNPEQSRSFSDQIIRNQLFSYLEKYRSAETDKGMLISINKQYINPRTEYLIENDVVHCYKSFVKDDDGEIRVIAGIAKPGEPEKAGWYIYCNGRLVLYADRTTVTGWGDKYRLFHNELAMFRGYVFFISKDLFKLPWNTTKTGVDVSNRLYSIAMDKMTDAVSQISIEVKKLRTQFNDEELENIFKNSVKVEDINEIYYRCEENTGFEITASALTNRKKTISFSVPADKYDSAQRKLEVKTAKQLGEKIFQYYCEMEGI